MAIEQQSAAESIWSREMIVHPADLEIGNFVVRLDIPWIETPFPLQGVRIDSEETRDWFEDHCEWVVIDSEQDDERLRQQRAPSPEGTPSGGRARQPGAPSLPINALKGQRLDQDSIGTALKAYGLLDRQARKLFRQIREHGGLEIKTAERVVNELSGYLHQNLAAMVWLTRIKDRDDYTAQHSVNCAILALGLAHALEWSPDRIEQAGMAALLHDVGNVEVDPAILAKPDLLTADEYRNIKAHTRRGYSLLREHHDMAPVVALAALEHHERSDGRGYPDGKRQEEIDEVSRLVTIVDVYDAVTSERPYRPARSHHDALGVLWRGRVEKFDQRMVETFIQFMGWVAPGTLVRLSDGELAVVEETNIVHGFYPVVRKLYPGPAGYRTGERIDMAALRDASGNPVLHVESVLPDGYDGVNVKTLLVAVLD